MKLLTSARADLLGETINIEKINKINIRVLETLYVVTVQLDSHDENTWLILTNELSLSNAKLAYENLLRLLRTDESTHEWTRTWQEINDLNSDDEN